MTAPRVTVLIDAYNYGRFIEQAIESVLSQDFAMERVEVSSWMTGRRMTLRNA